MKISKFENIKITDAVEDLNPTELAAFDIDGNVVKTPRTAINRNIDGGFANSIYLITQISDGGSA